MLGGASDEVWWRRAEVAYTTNEIYMDIVEKVDMVLTFDANETEKTVDVAIVDDDIWEPDETFEVLLEAHAGAGGAEPAVIGKIGSTEVTILNDDNPGMIGFETERCVWCGAFCVGVYVCACGCWWCAVSVAFRGVCRA